MRFGSCVTSFVSCCHAFFLTLVVIMDCHDHHGFDVDLPCAARRRRERRLEAFFRHGKLTVGIAVATVLHHSLDKGARVDRKALLDAATPTLDFFDIDRNEIGCPFFLRGMANRPGTHLFPHFDTQKTDELKILVRRTMAVVPVPPARPAQ